jgi:hypothetical protein
MARDEQFIYFAIDVKDDQLVTAGKAPWSQDGVELRLDARPVLERYANSGGGEGQEFLLLAVGPGPGRNECLLVNQASLPEGTQAACAIGEGGYTIEVRLPQSYLDKAQGGSWSRFRLNICVDDTDGESKSQLWWRPDWRSEMSWFG